MRILAKILLILALTGQFPYQSLYPDLNYDNPYYDSAYYCYQKNYIKGYVDGLFGGQDSLSRAMIVTILHRMQGLPASGYINAFPDVESDEWYSEALNWACENHIIYGYENGLFGPDDLLTREQLALIFYRLIGEPKLTNDFGVRDEPQISPFAYEAVLWAASEGMLQTTDLNVRPQEEALRQETAMFIYEYEQYLDPDLINEVEYTLDSRDFMIKAAQLKKTYQSQVKEDTVTDPKFLSGRLIVTVNEGKKLPNISAFHPEKVLYGSHNSSYIIQFLSARDCRNCFNYLEGNTDLKVLETDEETIIPID